MPKNTLTGRVHTNGLENFWSLFKRGIKGTYVSVEPFHLFRYLDEQAFRYNNRQSKPMNDGDRFEKLCFSCSRQAPHLCRSDWQGGCDAITCPTRLPRGKRKKFLDFFRFLARFSASSLAFISLCGTCIRRLTSPSKAINSFWDLFFTVWLLAKKS